MVIIGTLFALSEIQDQIILRTEEGKDWHLELTPSLLEQVQSLINRIVKVYGERIQGNWYLERFKVNEIAAD